MKGDKYKKEVMALKFPQYLRTRCLGQFEFAAIYHALASWLFVPLHQTRNVGSESYKKTVFRQQWFVSFVPK
jgi:hypothetical protein